MVHLISSTLLVSPPMTLYSIDLRVLEDCPQEINTDLSRVFKFIPNTGVHTDSTCSLTRQSGVVSNTSEVH